MIKTEWSDEDQSYIATTILSPYLSGIGSTKSNAIAHLRVAIELEEEAKTAGPKVAPWLDAWMRSIGPAGL